VERAREAARPTPRFSVSVASKGVAEEYFVSVASKGVINPLEATLMRGLARVDFKGLIGAFWL
jgi:hypothetical protein